MNLARESIELLEQVARILWFEGAKHGLRDREWMALRFLSRANRFSRTPSALASYVGTTRGTASFIIGELERLGYHRAKALGPGQAVGDAERDAAGQEISRARPRQRSRSRRSPFSTTRRRSASATRSATCWIRSDAAEQRHHTDVCKRCIFLREDRTTTDSKTAAEFSCRLFRRADRGGGGRSAMHQLRASPPIEGGPRSGRCLA